MAGGNMGDLWFSLDIKEKVNQKLEKLTGKIDNASSRINALRDKINEAGEALGKLEKGSNAWDEQKAKVEGYFRKVSELINYIKVYEEALGRVQRISNRVEGGGLLGPSRKITSLQDTKPLEDQINKYEKILQVQKDIADYQQRIANVRSRTIDKVGGFGVENYNETTSKLRENLASATAELNKLGGANMTIEQTKAQLTSLYSILENWDAANRRATETTDKSAEAERQRARTLKDARVYYQQYSDQLAKQERQEQRNQESIARSNAARQRSVQVLRQEAEAMMQNHIAALQAQKTNLGRLYSQGKSLGLDPAELETILNRYREISQQLLNMRSMMQNPGNLGYRDMFSMGRYAGVGANYVKEASQQVSGLRQRTQEATMAARDLASAFDRVHSSASKSSQVLNDIKSLFMQGGIVFAAQQFANSIIKTGGDIVQQHIALRSILGDVQKADTLFAQTQQLALQSPFTFQELNRDVKQLAAFGVDTDKLYDTTKRLADVASGLGVSFERLGLAYGQVKARSWLDGKELRQFAYAGLPMLQKIADLYNETGKNGKNDYTTSDVRSMITKRQVSFEDVDEVFKRLTDEGGQFYNMQFVLSDTLLGKWNKLQDAWTIMLGKFADGSNVLGSVFMGAIGAATTLIQKLDQLSPLVMSFGAMYALRKGASALSNRFGAGTIITDMQKAQTLALTNFQIRQMTQVAEGKITMEQAKQNIATEKNLLASKEAANMKYMQLAAEGKLSAFQVGRLAANQQVNLSLVKQLLTTGQISRYQAYLILQAKAYAGTWQGAWAQIRLGATSLWGSIKGFFSWGNVLMLGVSAAMSAVLSHEQKMSELASKAGGVTDKYSNKAAELNDTLSKVNGKISEDSIKAMEGALSKAGQLTDEVKNQVAEADNLNDKYKILKDKMQETLTMSQQLKNKDIFTNVLAASGGNSISDPTDSWIDKIHKWGQNITAQGWKFFGIMPEDISDNVAKLNELSNTITNYSQGLAGNFDIIDKAFKKTTAAAHDSVFYESIKDLPFEQKIRKILTSRYADDFIKNLKDIDSNAADTADDLKDYIDEYNKIVKDVTEYNVPHAVSELKKEMGLLGTDTSKWSQQQVNTFVWMFTEIMTAAGNMSDYVRSKVWQSFLASSNLMGRLNPDKKRVHTYLDPKTHKPWLTLYVGQEADDKKGHYVITGFKGGQPVKQYNNAADAPQPKSLTGSSEDDTGSKGKGKNKGGGRSRSNNADAERRRIENAQRKADNDDEKSLRARLNLIKEAYDTYQKYYKLLHNEKEAAKVVSEQYKDKGLSNDDVAKITSREGYMSLVDDYLTRARNIQYRRPSEMKDKKDEDIASGVQEKNNQKYDKLQDDMQKVASAMSHDLDEMSRKWENYNTVYKATGNADLAAQVSGLSGDMNATDSSVYKNKDYATGFVQSYSEYLKNYLNSLLWTTPETSQTAIDYNSLIGKSDKAIEDFAGKLFGSTKPEMINGFVDAMKKLRDLMTDSEFKEGIQVYSDLMNQIVSESAVVARNTQAYNNTIQKLDNLLAGNHITQEQYNQAKGVADAGYEHQNLIASDKYKQFMGQVTSMTENAANWMRDRIINDLDQQLANGDITVDKYIEGLKQVNDQMDAFRNQHGNGYAFFTGGLNGLASNMKNRVYDKIRGDMENGGGEYWNNGSVTDKGKAAMAKAGGFASTVGVVDAIVNGINSNVQSYKKLEETWTDAFGDGLKNSGFSRFMSGFTEASQGAADAWNSLKSGDLVGTLEGGVRSFTGWFSWGNAARNRRWQKQEEYLKGFQSTLNEINSTLKNKVSSNYGSMSASYARELKGNLNSESEQVRKTYYDWSQAHTLHRNHRNRMYTNLDYDAINEYLQSIGYSGDKVYADTIQNLDGSWLEKIRSRFAGDWSQIPEDARNYLNRLIEIEGETGEITQATDQLKEALTDLKVENLQSEYEELLNNLDSDNEDFADNLENHLRKAILSTMIANLYKKQIEDLVNFTNEQATNSSYVSKSGQVKQHTGGDDSADVMSEYTSDEYEAIKQREEGLAEQLRNSRDYLKDLYGWSDSNSSSMSSSIKGMSEQTGDLLAAYLNAIRADVSVIRQLSTVYLPKLDITTEAQLQQLNMIAANTLRNAEAAERIELAVTDLRDNFNRAQNQSKPVYVKPV